MLFELTFLRLLHVLLGVFWVGAIVFTTFFMMPALKDAGPAAGPVMAGLQARRFMVWIPIAAALTLLSGIRLFWIQSDGFSSVYLSTTRGMIYGVSAILAVVAFGLGVGLVRPAMTRVGALMERVGSAEATEREGLVAEANALRDRAGSVSAVVAFLLIAATAGMAVARYL